MIGLLILIATALHVKHGHKHDLKMDNSITTTYEPILSRTEQPENSIEEQDESTPLVTRPQRAAYSGRRFCF